MRRNCQIAAFYFPGFHDEPRRNPVWNEWELLQQARPRYAGHDQPKVPLWGYGDEADPAVMNQKINAAADAGLDCFLFDYYWYDGAPFFQRPLMEGFRNAPDRNRLSYAIMWANHNWNEPAAWKKPLSFSGRVDRKEFDRFTDHVIHEHFTHPCYWKLRGAPFFSLYELSNLVDGLGGIDETADALADFRKRTVQAGFPDLHLNAICFGIQLLAGERALKNPEDLVRQLRFSSVTSYVWAHHIPLTGWPETPAEEMFRNMKQYWKQSVEKFPVPYFPNVTMGWDPSPRSNQSLPWKQGNYPWTAIMPADPVVFGKAMRAAAELTADRPDPADRIITINAWNEWTEGSYLEPDTRHGTAFLDAIRNL